MFGVGAGVIGFPILWGISIVISIFLYKKLLRKPYRLTSNILTVLILYPCAAGLIVVSAYFIFSEEIIDYEWYRPIWVLFTPVVFAIFIIKSLRFKVINYNFLGANVTNQNVAATLLLIPVTLPVIIILVVSVCSYYLEYVEETRDPEWHYLNNAKQSVSHPYAGVWKNYHHDDSGYAIGPNTDGTYYVSRCNEKGCGMTDQIFKSSTIIDDKTFIIKDVNTLKVRLFYNNSYSQYERFIPGNIELAPIRIKDYNKKIKANKLLDLTDSEDAL